MTDKQKLEQFTQQIYLTVYNRRIDDIEDAEGQEHVAKAIMWANLFLDELEQEVGTDGMPINWTYLRENDKELGTISNPADTFELPANALRLVAEEDRPLIILQDGSAVSIWDVVDPNQITKRNNYSNRDQRVTYVNQKIVFSRPLNDTEVGGTVHTDIVNKFPRLASDNTELLSLPIPTQLLVLGTAKNSSLPDIVQGGLSPSYTQKFASLLEGHKMANSQTSVSNEAVTEDYSSIRGVY